MNTLWLFWIYFKVIRKSKHLTENYPIQHHRWKLSRKKFVLFISRVEIQNMPTCWIPPCTPRISTEAGLYCLHLIEEWNAGHFIVCLPGSMFLSKDTIVCLPGSIFLSKVTLSSVYLTLCCSRKSFPLLRGGASRSVDERQYRRKSNDEVACQGFNFQPLSIRAKEGPHFSRERKRVTYQPGFSTRAHQVFSLFSRAIDFDIPICIGPGESAIREIVCWVRNVSLINRNNSWKKRICIKQGIKKNLHQKEENSFIFAVSLSLRSSFFLQFFNW